MPGIEFIPKEKVLEMRENDEPFRLVEVLGQDQYEDRHLPGAINIPLDELEDRAPEELDKDETIVVYCASYTCQASTKAAEKLTEMGYENVMDYKGSKADWEDAGLPFESGEGEQVSHQKHEQLEEQHGETCKYC